MDYLAQAKKMIANANTVKEQRGKTAYQQNVQQPVEQPQKDYTLRGLLGVASNAMSWNPYMANKLVDQIGVEMNDPNSKYYNPYNQPTNRAVSNLAALGFDTNNLNDEWWNANQGWVSSNLVYNGTTNTPSSVKKGTRDQKIAYELYQWHKSEDTTKKAEQEWQALQDELSYWAKDTSRNYSDDQILQKIDWSKYKTLASMDENKYLSPTELNRSIGYSEDAMYGVMWAARNPDYQGDLWGAMANSALGTGNQYTENPEISAKLNKNDLNTYSPYSVGMTLEEEGLYFNVQKFDRKTLDDIRANLDWNDATAVKYYQNAEAAYENTQQAIRERDLFMETLKTKLNGVKDPDRATQIFENLYNGSAYDKAAREEVSFSTLRKMDESLVSTKLLPTTEAVDWKKEDMLQYALNIANENAGKQTGNDVSGQAQGYMQASAGTSDVTPTTVSPKTEEQKAADAAADESMSDVPDLVGEDATPMEQEVMKNSWSVMLDYVYETYNATKQQDIEYLNNIINGTKKDILNNHASSTLGSIQGMYDYDMEKQNLESMQLELDGLQKKYGYLAYAGHEIQDSVNHAVKIGDQNYEIRLSRVWTDDGSYELEDINLMEDGMPYRLSEEEIEQILQSPEYKKLVEDENKRVQLTEQANALNTQMTDEQQADITRIRELELMIEDTKEELADGEKRYKEDEDSFSKAQLEREQSMFVMRMLGIDTSDFEKEDAAIGYLVDHCYDYEATAWSVYNPSDAYRIAIAEGQDINLVREEAAKGNEETTKALEEAKAVRDYLDETQLDIPKNYRDNLDRLIAKLERDQKDYEYFSLSANDDFDELVKKGKQEEFDSRPLPWKIIQSDPEYGWDYDEYYQHLAEDDPNMTSIFAAHGLRGIAGPLAKQMTEDEKNIYYYLMGKGDEEAAKDYVRSLTDMSYGVLQSRYTEELKGQVENAIRPERTADFKSSEEVDKWIAENGDKEYNVTHDEDGYHIKWRDSGGAGNFIGTNILAILASPLAAMSSIGYGAYSFFSGKELNPDNILLAFNNFKTSTREESAKAISEYYGEGTIAQKAVQTFYEIVTNRLDSLTNMVSFGGFTSGIGNEMLQEWISAYPMAFSAAMDTMMEVKRKGGSDAQAYGVGLAAFLAESGTEAISIDNIKGAFAAGEAVTAQGMRDFLVNWLTQSGISEMVGETANDIIENIADEAIMGELSDHKDRVWSYRMAGYEKDDAEAMARIDELKALGHTALVSYLSPGLDAVSYAAGRGSYYRQRTKQLQKAGNDVSIIDVLKAEGKINKAEREANKAPGREPGAFDLDAASQMAEQRELRRHGVANGEGAFNLGEAAQEQQTEQAPAQPETEPQQNALSPEAKEKQQQRKQRRRFAKDYYNLESVKTNADTSSKTAVVASVLDTIGNQDSKEEALAAATMLYSTLGEDSDPVNFVQGLLLGANEDGVNPVLVKQAVVNAALGRESIAAYQVIQSEEFQNADLGEQAAMLAATVEIDQNNQALVYGKEQMVQEYRVVNEEKELIKNGFLDGFRKASETAEQAKANLEQAKTDLKARQDELQAKSDAVQEAINQNNAEPTDDNQHAVDRALNEYNKANAVEQEYQQHLDNMQQANKTAQVNLKNTKQTTMRQLHEQAEANVAQMLQQRAEERAQRAAQMQAEAEQMAAEQAAAQAEEDKRSGKEAEDKTRNLAEDWANQMHLEGEERDNFIKRVQERQEQNTLGQIDMSGKVSNTEGYLALSAFSRKTGMPIKLSETLPEGVRGAYKDGVVYLNANIIRNGNMTVGQALVEAALHEYTHGMQKTKSYRKYSDTVLDILYGKGKNRNNQQLELDIQAKIDTYKGLDNLTREGAIQEIVADFARLKLADKEMVDRFMDAGLGGKMRNSLHNVNQALKNFFKNMTGEERAKAEDFRKAERLYQKALNEIAKTTVHPSGAQFSVSQFAQAAGMTFDEASQTLYNSDGEEIDGVTEGHKITPDMVKSMPVGRLLDAGIRKETISPEKAAVIQEQFAGLLNMCARYRTTDMIWEIAASTLDSQFSAIKSNSDKQYSTTVDFGTICAKTQAIVDQLSRNMLTLGRGLKINEILDVYNDVYNAGLSVPCPVCYVFSRWMGVPSLLNAMKDYQDRFLGKQGEEVSLETTQQRVDDYIKEAQDHYGIDETYGERVAKARTAIQEKIEKLNAGMVTLEENYAKRLATLDARRAAGKSTVNAQKQLNTAENKLNEAKKKLSDLQTEYDNAEVEAYGKAINKVKTKLDTDMNNILDKIDGGEAGNGLVQKIAAAEREGKDTTKMKAQLADLRAEADRINAERAKVDGYNWVTQALCYLDENGRYVVDQENFERTPDEILFDLNRTAEFSKYAKNWKYRSTRGAGMGKAILPYSGASLGDSVYGKNARITQNALLAQDYDQDAVDKGLESAIQKAKQQNLIGGQRFQSTSDYRAEWGLDYIMTFIEQQAIGSCGQLYTKVAEAVPLFAKAGIDTNLSVMPYGDGYHIDENGEVVLDFSDVTGMDVETAIELKNQYPNVQLILVGINDTHIMAALKSADIDFVIPWHSSGNSRDQLSSMMASVEEQLNESSDYTKLQSDAKYAGETALVDSAKAKLQSGEELTTAETNALRRENNRNVRTKIITGKFIGTQPTASEMNTINGSKYLQSLYNRFCVDESSECYHVALTSSQASQIFPYEYWQTDVTQEGGTKDTADENGRRFCEYCSELGYIPRFSGREVEVKNDDGTKSKVTYGNFSGMKVDANGNITFDPVKGYWKLLIDRSMYDLEGNYRSQQKIDVTNINMGEISEEVNPETGKYSLTNSDLSREDVAKKQKNRPKYRLDNKNIVDAHKQASKAFDDRMKLQHPVYNNNYQFSAYSELTEADIDQMLSQANEDYDNAVSRGDVEAAQETVDFVAEQAGYTIKAYHGTPNGKFNVFEKSKVGTSTDFGKLGRGFYFTTDEQAADYYARNTDSSTVMPVYLKLTNPFVLDEKYDNMSVRELYDSILGEGGMVDEQRSEELTQWLIDHGYDGIVSDNEYMVLNPENIKSADPVTYDDDGNVIPLSERFNTSNPDIRYSAGGEMTDADIDQMLSQGKWTDSEFDKIFDDFIASLSAEELDQLAQEEFGIPLITPSREESTENQIHQQQEPEDDGIEQLLANVNEAYNEALNRGDFNTARKIIDKLAEKAGYTFFGSHRTDADFTVFDRSKQSGVHGKSMGNGFYIAKGEGTEYDRDYFGKNKMLLYVKPGRSFDIQEQTLTEQQANNVYEKYFAPHHSEAANATDSPYRLHVLDKLQSSFQLMDYIKQAAEENNTTTDKIFKWLGYDSIKDGPQLVVFDPEQIKSFNLETFDDQGERINPDQRFNVNNPDIRWSIGGEITDEDIDNMLSSNGVIPQRQFGSQTIQKAEGVSDQIKNYLREHSDYSPDTNEAQVDRAIDWIMKKRSKIDPDGFWGALDEIEGKNFNPLTADGQAKMFVTMSLASNKDDINVQKRLADAINKQGTTIGQALQARKLYRLMTPAGRIAVLQKEVDNLNSQLVAAGRPGNVTLNKWIERAAAAAQTEADFRKAQEALWEELGSKLPVTWFDRLQAWRMVSMLGNPRTHIRNILGNFFFEPMVFGKNKIGAALESIFIKNSDRTKAMKIDRSLMDWIDADAERMQDTLTGDAKYSDISKLQQHRKPFGKSKLGQAAQAWSDVSSNWLEKEDWIFLKHHYKTAMGNWMTANKVTGEQLDNDTVLRDKARAYAIEEAQKATYRDANKVAEVLSKLDKVKGIRYVSTAVVPFKKTPMNILKRGIEYSPVGLLKACTADVYRLVEYNKWASGKKEQKADWALSPAQYIDRLSSGLSGTGVALLGAMFKALGWLTLGFDKKDPEDEFAKAEGKQEYALNVNLFGQNISYTLDWMAPACMPFFVGSTIMDMAQGEGIDLGNVVEGLGSITEPIWNLSMVDGISGTFKTSSYDETNPALQIMLKIGLNYLGSFIPTSVGQWSRVIDPARRQSYVKSGDKPSQVLYEFEKWQNKTPFSVWNIPYRDHRGDEDRSSWLLRLAENKVSPGYLKITAEDSSLKELHRLYSDNKADETIKKENLNSLVPSDADKSVNAGGNTIKLDAQQYDQLDYERKQMAYSLLDRLFADPYYADIDDKERISMVNDVWDYATQQAKFNQFPEYRRDDWVSRTDKNDIDPLAVIKKRSEDHIVAAEKEGWSKRLIEDIRSSSYDDIQLDMDTLELMDLDYNDIQKIVKDRFVKEYQKAYKDDDQEAMFAIREMLYEAGFDYDYDEWLKTIIKNEDEWLEDYT